MSTAIDTPATLATLTGREWAAVLSFASTDETRLNLRAVAIYQDGTIAATDGHRLVMRLPTGSDPAKGRGEPICVSYEDAMKIKKLAKSRDKITISAADGEIVADGEGQVLVLKLWPSTFPPLHAVATTPKGKPAGVWGVDPHLLGEVMTAFAKVHATQAVRVQVWGELDPIHVTANADGFDWFAVVMPCRL